jgi:hypothetical protein
MLDHPVGNNDGVDWEEVAMPVFHVSFLHIFSHPKGSDGCKENYPGGHCRANRRFAAIPKNPVLDQFWVRIVSSSRREMPWRGAASSGAAPPHRHHQSETVSV